MSNTVHRIRATSQCGEPWQSACQFGKLVPIRLIEINDAYLIRVMWSTVSIERWKTRGLIPETHWLKMRTKPTVCFHSSSWLANEEDETRIYIVSCRGAVLWRMIHDEATNSFDDFNRWDPCRHRLEYRTFPIPQACKIIEWETIRDSFSHETRIETIKR